MEELSRKTGLKIVALRHLDQYVEEDEKFGDIAPYDVGPEEFLNWIRGAEYVSTDSFHGTCFSVIHHKKFVIFNRYSDQSKTSKNSRVDSLCQNLNLSERRFSGDICAIRNEINYQAVDENLMKLKKQTEAYLDKAFDGLV